MTDRTSTLTASEMHDACELWCDLKRGVPDVQERFDQVAEHVRMAVLHAMVAAIDKAKGGT